MKIIDLHCDTLYKMVEKNEHTYLKNNGYISEDRLLLGDYMAQCFAIYTPAGLKGSAALEYFNSSLNKFRLQIASAPRSHHAANSDDITLANSLGMIAALLTVENAEFLDNDLDRLKLLTQNKIRILGLVHNKENCLAYPCTKQNKMPLKPFGLEVIDALDSTNIYIDVSHLSEAGFWDVAKISHRPIIATHSAAKGLFSHKRNLTDEQIKAIGISGGIIGVPFFSYFLNGSDKVTAADIIAHIKYIINLGGEDIAAIGTDFDGMDCDLFLNDAADMQFFAEALIRKLGFNTAEKICHKNALRIFE